VDYSDAYPKRLPDSMGEVSYEELRGGRITLEGKEVPTSSLSSYPVALQIADELKEWIQKGEFLLTESVAPLPGGESEVVLQPMKDRPIEDVIEETTRRKGALP
jgi:uncharacterized protein (DUF39 family)